MVNTFVMCVANLLVNGRKHTITWHVHDFKSSHEDNKVNGEDWPKYKYANESIREGKRCDKYN